MQKLKKLILILATAAQTGRDNTELRNYLICV